ncbi:unnamed protein product [Chironomus riparius]|uniref:Uncharacterized protein n=1 Tax=Chironomus riparius TaxID=315576 RepID=A0A9N9S2E6_9DIPT|nr:unnamed protein product [Chironomus riparius]
MDSSVKSSSSGVSDSWLYIKNIDEDEINAGKIPDHIKTTQTFLFLREEMEDSDGISIISESEMNKEHTASDTEIERGQIAEEIDQEANFEAQDEAKNNQDNEDPNLLTPPSTPYEITEEEQELPFNALEKYEVKEETPDTATCHKNSHGVLLLIGMSLIIAVLYTNVTSLKNELAKTVSVYEQRILRLEEENQVLRTRLDELMTKLEQSSPYTTIVDALPVSRIIQDYQTEQETTRRPPVTKDVWLGGEREEVVKVLDKKYNSLPDYCYFTDEDDLFYEYNLENCEKKKQKMEERLKKLHDKQDKSIDDIVKRMSSDIYKSNDIMYNDFISKTTDEILKSFDDEIQEIKSSRLTTTADVDDNLSTKTKENKQKPFDGSNLDKKRKPQQPKNEESVNPTKKRKAQHPNNYEGSGKQDKKTKKRVKNQENNVDADKAKNQQKRQKLTRQKAVNEDDWIERRSSGREDARMKQESDENWYLKRKNDREIHRLTETIGN